MKFFRGVDAEFTAYSYVWGSVVEDVSRAPAKKTIALGIGIGAEVEEHFTGIVNVHAIINDDDVLGEHHLAHAPQAVHDFECLHRVGFFDAHEDKVVKYPLGR